MKKVIITVLLLVVTLVSVFAAYVEVKQGRDEFGDIIPGAEHIIVHCGTNGSTTIELGITKGRITMSLKVCGCLPTKIGKVEILGIPSYSYEYPKVKYFSYVTNEYDGVEEHTASSRAFINYVMDSSITEVKIRLWNYKGEVYGTKIDGKALTDLREAIQKYFN